MPNIAGHFEDSLVVFYDNNNNYITKTIINDHDRHGNYIEISEGLENIEVGTRLNMLIIHPDGASEFGGVLKTARSGSYEVTLFNERWREARDSLRHTMNSPAAVKSLVVDSKQKVLQAPLLITIVNISTTGVLIHSNDTRFMLGCVLQIEFSIHGKSSMIYGRVVREQVYEDDSFGFGCQLIFLR